MKEFIAMNDKKELGVIVTSSRKLATEIADKKYPEWTHLTR